MDSNKITGGAKPVDETELTRQVNQVRKDMHALISASMQGRTSARLKQKAAEHGALHSVELVNLLVGETAHLLAEQLDGKEAAAALMGKAAGQFEHDPNTSGVYRSTRWKRWTRWRR